MKRRAKRTPLALPPRLIEQAGEGEGEGGAAALLKRFERQTLALPPEEAVWNRTLARLVREAPRQRMRLVAAAACGVVVGVLATQAVLRLRDGETAPATLAVAHQPPVLRPQPAAAAAAGKGLAASGVPASFDSAAVEVTGARRIVLSERARALPAGPSTLEGEAEVILSTDGRAWATVEPGAAVVALEAGSVELHVEKRAAGDGRRFDVRAGGYRFTVLGTKFEVSRRADGRVRLAVTEGRVAVFRAEHRLAVVAAGGAWSSGAAEAASGTDPALEAPPPRERADEGTPRSPLAKPESPAASAPGALASPPVTGGGGPPVAAVVPAGDSGPSALGTAPRMVPPPFDPPPLPAAPDLQPGALRRDPPLSPPAGGTVPESSCVASARGDVRRLLACYLEQARGSGLPAEVALYESARLRQDSLADLPGALDLLREHRSRFPSGTLTFEVRLSMAELLPRLGHHREALAEIDWLLDAQGAVHRRGELLLLRGHVLREGFSDWAGAERAYGRAVEARAAARTTDAAAFWQAVCLEALGRKDEARRAYDHYLTRPHSALREQAEARLRALDREHSPGGKARSR